MRTAQPLRRMPPEVVGVAVLATTVSTAAAGGAFAWLRLRSRRVLAPILAHAAVNVSAYLAGRRGAEVLPP